jgi:hypothetical protein
MISRIALGIAFRRIQVVLIAKEIKASSIVRSLPGGRIRDVCIIDKFEVVTILRVVDGGIGERTVDFDGVPVS